MILFKLLNLDNRIGVTEMTSSPTCEMTFKDNLLNGCGRQLAYKIMDGNVVKVVLVLT